MHTEENYAVESDVHIHIQEQMIYKATKCRLIASNITSLSPLIIALHDIEAIELSGLDDSAYEDIHIFKNILSKKSKHTR